MKKICLADLSSVLKHISLMKQQSLCRKFYQTSTVAKQKACFNLGHSERRHEVVHIDKSQEPFNALSKKEQLITVCLRTSCKDRSIR